MAWAELKLPPNVPKSFMPNFFLQAVIEIGACLADSHDLAVVIDCICIAEFTSRESAQINDLVMKLCARRQYEHEYR